jgi:hypothetical protein
MSDERLFEIPEKPRSGDEKVARHETSGRDRR